MPVTLAVYRYTLLFLSLWTFLVKGQELLSDETTSNGLDYGSKWMYFPDGDGVPQPISLEMPSFPLMQRMNTFYDIEYRLYTRDNVNNYVLLDENAKPLNETMQFQEKLSTLPIKVITHGWESSADKNSVVNMKDAYLKTKEVAVIGVDWGDVANNYFYPMVAYQTTEVGKRVGQFLDALSDRYKVTGDKLHLIGHSLGAHVMGNAGRETKMKIARITGLDPARPLFEFARIPGMYELDTTDADFVDVVHTCGGILGVEEAIGHVDFFPNRGIAPQPGCLSVQHFKEACSHSRSHFYFTESILYPTAFPARKCKDWAEYLQNKCNDLAYMGENVNRSAVGTYYLETNQRVPYGRGLTVNK